MAKLSDIFDLQMGKTPARANSDYWDNGTNSWVSIADLSGYEKYVDGTKEKITDIAVQESGIKAVPPNTVIMSFKLSLGKTAITKDAIYTNEAIMAFIPNGRRNISPDYFFYMLSGRDWSKGTNRAVMGATLNKATLGEVNVTVPPIEEQRYVAAVLDKLSSLISLRKQQLAKLDELVKARFVEMFGASNAEVCTRKIGDYAEVLGGYAFKSDSFLADAIPVIRISSISEGSVTLDYTTCYSEKFWRENAKFRVKPLDILMAMSGATTGKSGIFKDNRPALINQRVACIRVLSGKACPEFLFAATQMEWMYRLIQDVSAGCAQPNISGRQIENMPVPDASYKEQMQFAAFVRQSDKSKSTIQKSLDKLELLKRSLMQKYFG